MYVFDHECCWENLTQYHKTLAASCQHPIYEDNALLAINNQMVSPLFNPVLNFSGSANEYSTVSQYLDQQLSYQSAKSWWVDSLRCSAELATEIKRHQQGFGPCGIMAMRIPERVRPDPSYDIRVFESSDLTVWMEPLAICFDLDPNDKLTYQRMLQQSEQHLTHVAAYEHDTIVGVASLFSSSVYAGFYNLAVRPGYRRRGIARQLKLHRMAIARDHGFKTMTLQATPDGLPVDRRMGMTVLSTLMIYW